MYEEEIHFRNC